jgi:hypothetical protein
MRTNINNVNQGKEIKMGKGNLPSHIGERVTFNPPRDVKAKGGTPCTGTIVDEVWATPDVNTRRVREPKNKDDWGDYSCCAQLIKWDENDYLKWGENDRYSIRLTYYRRRAGEDRWTHAGQTTVNSDWRTIKALLERTLAKTGWFSDSPIIQ